MPVDAASADHVLKELYPNKTSILTYQDHPLLAMIPKDTGYAGRVQVIDALYAETQGRSSDFASATAGSSQGVNFKYSTVEDYCRVQIPRKLLLEATGKGAIVDLFQMEVDSGFRSLGNSMALSLYGTGSGRLGQIATGGISTNTITLAQPNDVINFDKGMTIVLSTADGGGTVKAGTGLIDAVDRDNGRITLTQNVTTAIATAAALDYIFAVGDYDNKMTGIRGWIPDNTPSATLFFGVNRTLDPTRLAGVRFNGVNYNHEEALIRGIQRYRRERQPMIDVIMMHPDDVGALVALLGTRKSYVDMEADTPDGSIGFRALLLQTGSGAVKVVEDADCPKGRALGLYMKAWKLHSTGQAPEIFQDDGLKMLRVANADSYEVRIGYYAQVACTMPSANINIALAPV